MLSSVWCKPCTVATSRRIAAPGPLILRSTLSMTCPSMVDTIRQLEPVSLGLDAAGAAYHLSWCLDPCPAFCGRQLPHGANVHLWELCPPECYRKLLTASGATLVLTRAAPRHSAGAGCLRSRRNTQSVLRLVLSTPPAGPLVQDGHTVVSIVG